MKRVVSFLALIISYTTVAQYSDVPAKGPLSPGIFIDTSLKSRSDLTNFSFDNFDSTTYFEQLKSYILLSTKKQFQKTFPENGLHYTS